MFARHTNKRGEIFAMKIEITKMKFIKKSPYRKYGTNRRIVKIVYQQ